MSPKQNKVRWWPVWGILALAAILQIWAWGFGAGVRQSRVMSSLGFLMLTVMALLLWFFLLSRIRWKHRFWGPILAWRWNSGVLGWMKRPWLVITGRPWLWLRTVRFLSFWAATAMPRSPK